MPCRWPVLRTQPNSRCSASSTGAKLVSRARFFRFRNWAASWPHTDLDPSPTRSAWRFHVPRIWIRSINGRIFSVKRKTQNVVDVFVPRLFVVVPFPGNYLAYNNFRALCTRVRLPASNPKMMRAPLSLALLFSFVHYPACIDDAVRGDVLDEANRLCSKFTPYPELASS